MLPLNLDEVKPCLAKFKQEHLLAFWDELNNDEKQKLLEDINSIDLSQVCGYFEKTLESKDKSKDVDSLIKPLPEDVCGRSVDENKDAVTLYEEKGLKAVSLGQVAVLLLAGGQGTRLGVSYPKGMYVVDIPSKKSLFQLQAERIIRLQELAAERCGNTHGGKIMWYIMTSHATKRMTEDFFTKNNHFGLDADQVRFFTQGTLPCFDFDGKILLESKCAVSRAPDGNGGVYGSLRKSGVLEEMLTRSIKHIHVYCVDNILVRVADPTFIGYCMSKNADCGAKVVEKRDANEPVGLLCEVDGSYQVVEYSEMSSDTAGKRTGDGKELVYNAGNICNHYFHITYLERLARDVESKLPHHVAKKKIPHIDISTGDLVKPTKPNGIKMEKFVFDVFPFTKKMAVWQVARECEFSALKNADAPDQVDCPTDCKRKLFALHRTWIENAGGNLSDADGNEELITEISPLISYGGEGLEDLVKGKTLQSPLLLSSPQEGHDK